MLPHCTKNRHFRAIAYPYPAGGECLRERVLRGVAVNQPGSTPPALTPFRPRPSHIGRILIWPESSAAHQNDTAPQRTRRYSTPYQHATSHLRTREYSAPPPGGKYPTPKPFPPNQTSQNPRPTPHEKLAPYPRRIRDPRLTDFSASC